MPTPTLPRYLSKQTKKPTEQEAQARVSAEGDKWEANQRAKKNQAEQNRADYAALNQRLDKMAENPPPKVVRNRGVQIDQPMSVEEFSAKYGPAAAAQYKQYLENPNYRGSPSEVPQYEEGGMIGPGGQPVTPSAGLNTQSAAPGGQPMNAQVIDARLQEMMTANPQMAEQVKQAISQAMSTGELTPQELNTMVQMAKLAAQNPAMYPKIRQFAIAQGIATEQDLPPQYDEGLVITILAAAKMAQASTPGSPGQPAAAGQAPQASMATGGETPASKNSDGSVKIVAHEGEYVIPAHIVRQKGTDFFDKMIDKDGTKAAGGK